MRPEFCLQLRMVLVHALVVGFHQRDIRATDLSLRICGRSGTLNVFVNQGLEVAFIEECLDYYITLLVASHFGEADVFSSGMAEISWHGMDGMLAGSLLDFCMWESCWTVPLVGGFSRGFSIYSAFSFRHCSMLISTVLKTLRCQESPKSLHHSLAHTFWINFKQHTVSKKQLKTAVLIRVGKLSDATKLPVLTAYHEPNITTHRLEYLYRREQHATYPTGSRNYERFLLTWRIHNLAGKPLPPAPSQAESLQAAQTSGKTERLRRGMKQNR
ncbi:hypothetical protein PR048_017456 [Dryococelus australis]|uniref:Uncharacterized protein n=1 Tax=Dryococelus australis TaxID=614101 RepID=A0ABQ9H9K7_9NEOP|nr:hypothetical protein PR048_017456 [Dryococelus australis]